MSDHATPHPRHLPVEADRGHPLHRPRGRIGDTLPGATYFEWIGGPADGATQAIVGAGRTHFTLCFALPADHPARPVDWDRSVLEIKVPLERRTDGSLFARWPYRDAA